MKASRLCLLVCLSLLGLLPSKAKANHAAGAELLYEWVRDSTYRFYYKFYKDCGGSTPEPIDVPMCYYSTCNSFAGTVTLDQIYPTLPDGRPNGSEVSPGCPGYPTTCTQRPSGLPGYREWWYTGLVTLPSRCEKWIFYFGLNARSYTITNLALAGDQDLYVEATLNNVEAQGNTSPFFSVKPVPYICNNIPYTYNNGAYDRNNDSLSFDMVIPRTGGTFCNVLNATDIAYAAPMGTDPPYNINTNPLACNNTFVLDHANGQMSFTPNEVQQAVMTVRVSEHRNGKVIGTVLRDMQASVLSCNNPAPKIDVISSTVTGATYNGTRITGCATQPLSFCFNASSTNPGAVLVVRDNSGAILTGSTINYTNQKTSLVKGCLSWAPGVNDTGLKIFTITVVDSSCTPPGIIVSNTFSIPIYIWPPTTIYNDTGLCLGDTVQLRAVGGGDFVWTVLPGGSPLSSLSCTNCSSPKAWPTQTTRYVVVSQMSTACKNRDTVTIAVGLAPAIDAGADTIICVNDSVQLHVNVTTSGGGIYDILWSPATSLSSDTSSNPYASPKEDTRYIVTVTPNGVAACATRDTVNVAVIQGYDIFNSDTTICRGDVVQIQAKGDSRYSYKWTPDTGVSNINILNPLITTDSTRTYTITATYPGCTDSVQKLHIEVQPVPAVVALDDQMLCAGDTLHLSVIVTPVYDQYNYVWTPGSNLDDPKSSNPVFSGKISGQLKVVVSTPIGCKGSDSLDIQVVNADFLHISHDTVMCPHDSVQLHIEGDSLAGFYWGPNFRINDTTDANPFVSPERTQYYTVYGIDSTNCLDTVQVLVIVKPAALITLPDSVLIYPGDSYQLEPQTNCMYFSWFPSLGLTDPHISDPIASPGASTRYFVTGRTEFGCYAQDSIDILMSDDSQIDMPNAFAPGNGVNNILHVVHLGRATLKSFVVYDRWGIKVFETSNLADGWDGMLNNVPQPMGVYIYTIEAQTYRGRIVKKQGNVTLLR